MKAKLGIALGFAGIALSLVAGLLSTLSNQKMMESEVEKQVAAAINNLHLNG